MTINGISNSMASILIAEMEKKSNEILHIFGDLATGNKLSKASADPVAVAISSRLDAQVRGLAQAEQNAQMAVSMAQTADGYLDSMTQDMQRIRELGVQASNGTLTDADRQAIQAEVDQLKESISYNLNNASFNQHSLFDGGQINIQTGAGASGSTSFELPNISSQSLGLETIDMSTQAAAQNSISSADSALSDILSARTELGASQNGLESTIQTLSTTRLNTMNALSQLQDTNMAEEIMKMNQATTALEAQAMVLSQVLKLDGGLVSILLKSDNQ